MTFFVNSRNSVSINEAAGCVVKKGIGIGCNPAEEYPFWKCFKNVCPEMIPDCLDYDCIHRTIEYALIRDARSLSENIAIETLDAVLDFIE